METLHCQIWEGLVTTAPFWAAFLFKLFTMDFVTMDIFIHEHNVFSPCSPSYPLLCLLPQLFPLILPNWAPRSFDVSLSPLAAIS